MSFQCSQFSGENAALGGLHLDGAAILKDAQPEPDGALEVDITKRKPSSLPSHTT